MAKKKKTPTEKYIDKAVAQALKAAPNGDTVEISHCEFAGVKYDAKAIESINIIAQGIFENAQAVRRNADGLVELALVLKASNVHVDTMVTVGVGEKK